MTADLTPAGSAAVRLADALVRTKKQRDRARDLACAYEAQLAKVHALAENWRYKGEFGWGPWQSGEGPDPEGQVLDECAADLRRVLDVPDE